MNGNGRPTLEYAHEYAAAGISVVDVVADGTKKTRGKWKELQSRILTPEEIDRRFRGPVGIATITGAVSGNAEAMDVDRPALVEPFEAAVRALAPGLLERLTIIASPRNNYGGRHYRYRVEGRAVAGNTKLAQSEPEPQFEKDGTPLIDPKTGKQKIGPTTWIETRGEGGYILAPGCPGECHETGLPYKHLSGPPLAAMPTITAEEHEILWRVAQSFNQYDEEEQVPREPREKGDGLTPGDDYNLRATWEEVLGGWTKVHSFGDVTHWRRPGKSIGTSGTTGLKSKVNGTDLFCCFSSNAHPFQGAAGGRLCTSYSKFAAYALLNHNGDYSAAAKTLYDLGYGERRDETADADDKPKRKKRQSAPVVVSEPASTDLRSPSGRTDRANALRFVAIHGADVRWCDPWGKWLIWDGKRHAIDQQRRIESLAKQVADLIWREVAALLPNLHPITAAEVVRFARATSNTRGISDMLTSVKSEPGIAIMPAQLDAHPWLLNCDNGTVDLKTGGLLPHNREHFLTKICPHPYLLGPEAECPIWETTIDKIFGGNADLVGFFRRWCGSTVVGEVIEHILAIFWGVGSNGKSLIVETLLEALGDDYATKGASDLLLATHGDRHPTEKADLFGKRLVIVNETDDGRRLAEGVVKELTGGDTVKARRMREDFWSFRPSHSLALVSNYKPDVKGTDHGIWRRLRLLAFLQKFWDRGKGETGPAEYEANPRLKDELRPELPGIVAWMVRGCIEWQRQGLGQPAEVTAATTDYRDSMNTLALFFDDCCSLEEGMTVKASEMRKSYVAWCDENGEKPVSGRKFGEFLADKNVAKRKSNGTWYSGVTLR